MPDGRPPRRRGARARAVLGGALLASAALAANLCAFLCGVPDGSAGAKRLGGRRELVQSSLLAALSVVVGAPGQAALAAKEAKLTEKDLTRVVDGYRGLRYLMDNWDEATRDCRRAQDNVQQALQSGVLSPNKCVATPLAVRNYLGCSKMDHPLFQSDKLWIRIQTSDFSPQDEDAFIDAWEDFEKHKRTGDEWAFTSSWGEANPGGGRDKVEDYLLRSKKEVALATEALGKIVKILNLAA